MMTSNPRVTVNFFSALFAMVFVTAASFVPAARAESAVTPSQFVQKLGDAALSSLTGKDMTRSAREQKVRDLLQNNFDLQVIGKFAMGTYWKDASESQRKEYLSLFENMVVGAYTTRFEDYSGQKLKTGSYASASASDFLVNSQVIQKDGPPVNLEWRVRNKDGNLKIVDVVVEGVSMSVTQRADFSAVIQRGGGNIEALLATLREKNKAYKKG